MSIDEIAGRMSDEPARGGPSEQPHDPSLAQRGADATALHRFGPAWLRAVAMVWSEPAQLEPLKRDPRRFLATHCAYELPPEIALTVREAREAPNGALWHVDAPADGPSLTSRMTLYIPPAPRLEERAIALAAIADDCILPPVCVC
jgi:ribosomally synthesized peptide (two-chain TOMM family)